MHCGRAVQSVVVATKIKHRVHEQNGEISKPKDFGIWQQTEDI